MSSPAQLGGLPSPLVHLQVQQQGEHHRIMLMVMLGRGGGKSQSESIQALTFSLGAVVDLAVLLGDRVGVGGWQQVLGGARHPVLTLVLGAQVGGGGKDPGLTTEGAVI